MRGRRRHSAVLLVLSAAVVAAAAAPSAVADAAPRTSAQTGLRVAACSRGLVALTFDDGPQPGVTPRLLDVLTERKVPATFFVAGARVRAAPRITRRASRLGFAIGNHTYRHEDLTRLSDAAIERTLRRTRRAIRTAGAHPSGLMRPPYGNIDDRVRAVVARMGLVPVLWTIDPRDWAGGSGHDIANRVISALEPHQENLVLLHDGVANSPNTVAAVPGIIRRARMAGYCFARLGRGGHPVPPVPRVGVAGAAVTEGAPGQLTTATVTVRLDRPTSRPTAVRVRTRGDTATSGSDFVPVDTMVRFPVGTVRRTVAVEVRGDAVDEPTERLTVRLSHPTGVRISDRIGSVRIADDDQPPGVRVRDAVTTRPETGQVAVPVTLRLSARSGRTVVLHVVTADGTASAASGDYDPVDQVVAIAAGRARTRVEVVVNAEKTDEGAETFHVRVTAARHATLRRPTGTVTIQPPQ